MITDRRKAICDDDIKLNWYRFGGINNNNYVLRNSCIEDYGNCGTLSPGWIKNGLPKGLLAMLFTVLLSLT